MFQQLQNIDTAFKHIRLFTAGVIVLSLTLSGYVVYKSFGFISASQERIYILANGKALEAWSSERKDNIPVEARDHIKMFHLYFFTLDPDEKVIQTNLTKALYLADASAKRQYDNLKESRYFSNLISGNISQEIEVDSIQLDLNHHPIYFKYYGKQKLIRTSSIVTRQLITEGFIRNVNRSDHNPHGFLIEKWNTVENKDLKTENR